MKSLYHLRRAGFRLRLNDGGIDAGPADALTETVRNFIKEHRDEITNELRAEQQQRDLMTAERTVKEIMRQFSKHKELNHD